MKIKTHINIAEKLWRKHPEIKKEIKLFLQKSVQFLVSQNPANALLKANFEVSIMLTNDSQIQDLNKNYRQKDKPTNVLSFPLFDIKKIKNGNWGKIIEKTKKEEKTDNKYINLGDIAISYQTLFNEAKEQNKSFRNHLAHLTIHSFLHLIGFDHIKKKDAEIMEGLEIKILKYIEIDNPYIIQIKT